MGKEGGRGGERSDGVISCVWSTFEWANVDSVDVFSMHGEHGCSFKGSLSNSR